MNPDQPQNTENPPPATTNRRRSSGFMPSFDGLQNNRREAQSVARRQSMSDQQAKLGVFGQFFHNTFGKNTK
ncbi:hypothetical protein K4F52_005988 [Lecanicillium sp. MT-2017a]|nr:hypothetical protein K4F52_005988 [Lecanicillium sp. MT-2017a]